MDMGIICSWLGYSLDDKSFDGIEIFVWNLSVIKQYGRTVQVGIAQDFLCTV